MNFAILEEQLKTIVQKIREVQSESFEIQNENVDVSSILEKKLTIEEFAFVRNNFPSVIGKSVTEAPLALNSILDEIKNVDLLELTVPIDTSVDFDMRMTDVLDSKIDKPICVRIKSNKALIAGARIEFAGKVNDYSIQKSINEIFEINKND